MKIEVTCSHCDSVLRVASEHAGKQLRCPTCGTLCNIPSLSQPTESGDPGPSKPAVPRPIERGKPNPDYKPPVYIGPQSAPLNPDQPGYRPIPPPRYVRPSLDARDENLGRSYLMFGLGVVSAFTCGCVALFIAPVLFSKGIAYARASADPNANVAFSMNLVGMIFWAIILLVVITGALFH